MPKITAIDTGARIYAGDEFVGTVEHAVKRAGTPATDYPDLIVRADEDGARYALPGALVRSRRRNHGHTTVHVDLGGRPLSDFLAADATVNSPDHSDAERQDARPASEPQEWRVPVWREELVAEKRPVERDTVHVRKRVETTEQQINVPLEREEVVIEHLSPDEYGAAYGGQAATGQDEWIIPVHEERLVVQKQTVIVEYLRVSRRRHTEDRAVHDSVRREVVAIDSDATGHLADSVTPDDPPAPVAP